MAHGFRTSCETDGQVELSGRMRIPGPYFDDSWDWLPRSHETAELLRSKAAHRGLSKTNENSPGRVIAELSFVLLVPLAGAAVVELILLALRIY
jgi:hypothetical protein